VSGRLVELSDPAQIVGFLARARELHFYELGDLDPFFWPHTRWHAWQDGAEIEALCLLYGASDVPTLLAFAPPEAMAPLARLLQALEPALPARLYAHLSPGLIDLFGPSWRVAPHGPHRKMVLARPEALDGVDVSKVVSLGPQDLPAVLALYERAYPGNWFSPRMLETGLYRGIRSGAELAAIAGVHVFAPGQRVVALGNVATDPRERRRGHARAVTAALCRELLHRVDTVGLNVHAANAGALACYAGLGFRVVADYDELGLERISPR
jgi:RimJ/RimL family protein N-acetyltransferase